MLHRDKQAQISRDTIIIYVNAIVQENINQLKNFLSLYESYENQLYENFTPFVSDIFSYLDLLPESETRLSFTSHLFRINKNIEKIINSLETINPKQEIIEAPPKNVLETSDVEKITKKFQRINFEVPFRKPDCAETNSSGGNAEEVTLKEELINYLNDTHKYIKKCSKYMWSPSPQSSPTFSKPFHETSILEISNKENMNPNIKMGLA